MSKILTKDECGDIIYKYYLENYGERESDVWFEPPAANVRTFLRDGKYISIKCHILTGNIEVFVE